MSTFPDPPQPAVSIPAGTPIEIVGESPRGEEREAVRQPDPPYISFEHVSKSFGDVHVLDDVSFSVQAGETLCILGRSGVGKSVSLQQIMGFLKPDAGRIMVAGQDITGLPKIRWRPCARRSPSSFRMVRSSTLCRLGENVAFPLRERGQLLEDQIQQVVNGLLDMVGVAGMADLLPSDLSTGMKRSVAIARALSAQPEAILYDEPTTMVDPLMGRLLGNLIQKLKHQLRLTSIVVTHDMRFAERLADHVLFLHQAAGGGTHQMDRVANGHDHPCFLELRARRKGPRAEYDSCLWAGSEEVCRVSCQAAEARDRRGEPRGHCRFSFQSVQGKAGQPIRGAIPGFAPGSFTNSR